MPDRFPPSLTTEIGYPGTSAVGGIIENWEETAELRWPQSVAVYDRMRRTDGQTGAVLRAIGLPIRRTRWRPAGSDCDPRVVAFVEAEMGLQVDERGRRRRIREGISFNPYLRHALISLPIGHMPLEQVYEIGPPPPGIDGLPPMVAHLRKLAPRMPRTIVGFNVARDGGLLGIRQLAPGPTGILDQVTIPVERLVMHVNEQEGADWTGTSILRVAYKHWLLKDAFLRLSAVAGERNSLGLPVVNYGAGGDKAEALRVAKGARAGEEAGIALPPEYGFKLEGVTGNVFDLLAHINYHDQAIGRSALAMFLNLGHDGGIGHGSIGSTFVDYFALSVMAVVDELEETMTEYVVRDLVALNFGPDEPYPTIVADDIDPAGPYTAEALAALVNAGVIIPDDDLEAAVRARGELPPAARATAGPGGPPTTIDPNQPGGVQPTPIPPGRPQPQLPPGGIGPAVPLQPTAAAYRGRTVDELEQRLEGVRRQLAARRAARRADAPAGR